MDMEYKEVYHSESWGPSGLMGVKIMVAIDRKFTDNDKWAASELCATMREKLQEETMDLDPTTAKKAAKEKSDIVALFTRPIFVEEIPNGYAVSWYNKHLPWFKVTTPLGHITIGWRKRVIEIDWSGTTIDASAEDLFPAEHTTKHKQSIHAWGLEDAKKYIEVIMIKGGEGT